MAKQPCNDCGEPNDWYMVSHELWESIGMNGGSNKDQFLCFYCLEKRVGRPLTIADFPPTHPSGDDMPVNRAIHFGYGLAEAAHKEVTVWAQAVLTGLAVGDIAHGSPIHLKLREVMIAFRAAKAKGD